MKVTFDGKEIKIEKVGEAVFEKYVSNVSSGISGANGTQFINCFSDAYAIVLKARLGTNSAKGFPKAGIATEKLKASIKFLKESTSVNRIDTYHSIISIVHNQQTDASGNYISNEGKDIGSAGVPKRGDIMKWITAKGITPNKQYTNSKRSATEQLAASIVGAMIKAKRESNSSYFMVLPKWNELLSNKNKVNEVFNALATKSDCISKNILKLMKNG
jgi:hypothetical protein